MPNLLLHLDSSILGKNSVSRALSASVVARLAAADSSMRVTYRDLAAVPIPHLSGSYLAAASANEPEHTPELQADLALGSAVLEEFLAADVVVIGVAFYNFGISSQLKAWIDRLAVAGKTFRYTEQGPVGLAAGKRVVLAIARGGHYGPGSPVESFEHAETYLRNVLAFFGISNVQAIAADGLAAGPAAHQAAIQQANEKIAALHV